MRSADVLFPKVSGLPPPTRHGEDMAEEPPVDFWIEGMLATGGIMLIAAQKKVGKSTLLANLARSVLMGEPFLSRECKQGSVLYLSADEPKRSTLGRLDRVGILRHPNLSTICHRQFDPQWKVKLKSYVTREKYNVVIIDTLFKLAGLTEIKDTGPWSAAFQYLKLLADELGCTIFTTAHAKKEGQGTNAVAGSYQVTAEPDATLVIESAMNKQRYIFTEQRDGTDLERTILNLDKDSMLVTVGEELWVQRLREAQQEIIRSIGEEPMTRDELVAKVHKRRGLVIEAIGSAVSSGWLTRSGAGTRYDPYRYAVIGSHGKGPTLTAIPEPPRNLSVSREQSGTAGTPGTGEEDLWAGTLERANELGIL